MDDNARLEAYGHWLSKNQHQRGSDDWNTVAAGFQDLLSAQDKAAAQSAEYSGFGGLAQAALQGAATGALGDTMDFVNQFNPVYHLMRGATYLATGEDKMGRPHMATAIEQSGLGAAADDIPAAARTAYYGGRAFGGAAGLGALTGGAGAMAGALAPQALATSTNPLAAVGRFIVQNPGKYFGGEMASATGAGTGTAWADVVSPDDETGRLVGGLLGSVLGPTVLVRGARRGAAQIEQELHQPPVAGMLGSEVDPADAEPLVRHLKRYQNQVAEREAERVGRVIYRKPAPPVAEPDWPAAPATQLSAGSQYNEDSNRRWDRARGLLN